MTPMPKQSMMSPAPKPQASNIKGYNGQPQNIPVSSAMIGGGSMAGMPQGPMLPAFGGDITQQQASKQREQYKGFNEKYQQSKQIEQPTQQDAYNPLKKTVEQIKSRVPESMLVGMSDKQILAKAYEEMPNFRAKLDETLIKSPFRIYSDREGYGFGVKGKKEIKELESQGLLKDEHKAYLGQSSVWDDLKIDNEKLKDNMDRLSAKMSLNPTAIYASGTTREDKIDMIKDQVEYFGNYILNAVPAVWNNLTDLIPGIGELSKSMVEDPGSTATAVVDSVKTLIDNPEQIPEIISKNPIDAILIVEGITQIPRLAKGVSKLPQNTQNFIKKTETLLGDIKKGSQVAIDDVVNTRKDVSMEAKTIEQTKDIAKTTQPAVKPKPTRADMMIERTHKFTDSEIRKYEAKYGETPGQTLNNRGLIAGGDETLKVSLDDMVKYQKQKSEGLSNIQKKIPVDDDVIQIAKEVAEHEKAVLTPEQIKSGVGSKWDDYVAKAERGELSHVELEEIKKMFEAKKSLKYDATRTSVEQERLKNLDSSIRTKQQKRAEEAGFDNIKDINKEISKSKAISDLLAKDVEKIGGLGLSDYVLIAGATIEPSTLALLVSKKIAQTNWFKKGAIKILNKINGKETQVEKIADIKKIQQISSETQLDDYLKGGELKQPALPTKISQPNLEPGKTNIVGGTTIKTTPEGLSIREGRIGEIALLPKKPTNVNPTTVDSVNSTLGIKDTKIDKLELPKKPTNATKKKLKTQETPKTKEQIKRLENKDEAMAAPAKKEALPVKDEIKQIDSMAGVKKEVIDVAGGNLQRIKYTKGDMKLIVDKFKNGEIYYAVDYGNSSIQQMSKSEAISEFTKIAKRFDTSKLPVKKPLPMNEKITQPTARVKAPEEPLIKEARKYKSADEFVDSLPNGGIGRINGKGEGYVLAEKGKSLYDFGQEKINYYFKDGKIPDTIKLYRGSSDIKNANIVPGDYLSRNKNVAGAFGTEVKEYNISSKDLTYGKGKDDFVYIKGVDDVQTNLKQIREQANKKGLPKK